MEASRLWLRVVARSRPEALRAEDLAVGPRQDVDFEDHLGEAFTVPRALAYLRTLAGESLNEAVRYIENAPAATDTPLRRVLAEDAWWRGEARRLGLR